MNKYRVYINGLEYEVQASSVPVAIRRGINEAYLKGIDSEKPEEERRNFIKSRKKHLNRKNDINREDEGSFNIRVWVKRIA